MEFTRIMKKKKMNNYKNNKIIVKSKFKKYILYFYMKI